MYPELPSRHGSRDAVDNHHDAGVAMWAFPRRLPSQRLETIAVVGGRIGCRPGRCYPEQFPTASELLRTMAVAEESIQQPHGRRNPVICAPRIERHAAPLGGWFAVALASVVVDPFMHRIHRRPAIRGGTAAAIL
jgi:hypothetical protein